MKYLLIAAFIYVGVMFLCLWLLNRRGTAKLAARDRARMELALRSPRGEHLRRDAEARQRGENLDGTPRRQTYVRYPETAHPRPTAAYGARYDSRPDPADYSLTPGVPRND